MYYFGVLKTCYIDPSMSTSVYRGEQKKSNNRLNRENQKIIN
jgi:hypothetical protein